MRPTDEQIRICINHSATLIRGREHMAVGHAIDTVLIGYADAREEAGQNAIRVAELEVKAEKMREALVIARDALHRDRTGLAAALDKIAKACRGRLWITDGRGPYEWDDDLYKEEAGEALREVIAIATTALNESGNIAQLAIVGTDAIAGIEAAAIGERRGRLLPLREERPLTVEELAAKHGFKPRNGCVHGENEGAQCGERRALGRFYCAKHAEEADGENQ